MSLDRAHSARKEEEKILSLAAGRPAIWTLSRSWDLHWKTCAPASARENLPGRQRRWHCGQDSWFSFPSRHYTPVLSLVLYLPLGSVHLPSNFDYALAICTVPVVPFGSFFDEADSTIENCQKRSSFNVCTNFLWFLVFFCPVSRPELLQIKIVYLAGFFSSVRM